MCKIRIRRLCATVGLVIAVSGATAASAVASAAGGPQDALPRAEVFQLVAEQTQSASVDLGKKGLSLGDEKVIAEDLYRNGKKVGDHSVVCTYIHLHPDALQCVGTFSLPEGQISGQALLHLPPGRSVDLAVTGGSGTNRLAQGYVRTVAAGTTERHLTFHITR
jgi:hypothetical protein